ncbi:MAG: hypothetical protein WCA17_07825 [Burkholderiales bacterium]
MLDRTKRLNTILALVILAASTYALAVEWVLTSSNKEGWDVKTVSTHGASAAWLGSYYRTYPATVQAKVSAALARPGDAHRFAADYAGMLEARRAAG